MGTIDDGYVVAAGIGDVDLVRNGVHSNRDWVLGVNVRQRGCSVLRAINDVDAAWVAVLRIPGVRHVDEVCLGIDCDTHGRSPHFNRCVH